MFIASRTNISNDRSVQERKILFAPEPSEECGGMRFSINIWLPRSQSRREFLLPLTFTLLAFALTFPLALFPFLWWLRRLGLLAAFSFTYEILAREVDERFHNRRLVATD